MNLVKWFRKNNMKVMAVVIIIIMFGFIGGEFFRQLSYRRSGLHKAIAYFGQDGKITQYDIGTARQELQILESLRAEQILRSIPVPPFPQSRDFRALLLAELLFTDKAASPGMVSHIKRIIMVNNFRISDKQINDIYERSMPSDIYWLLLKKEADLAGIRAVKDNAGRILGSVMPQLFPGQTYSQGITTMVNRLGVSEDKILATFAELLSILEYAKAVCSNEAFTMQQIRHDVIIQAETVDVEFVRFDSSVFAEAEYQPTEQEISAHFNKYKQFFAGSVSEENPYGFGYKLPDRVRLEYIVLKLDDVAEIITPPAQEEVEEYYQKYREQFVEQIPSDPNDPNSPLTGRTKSYAEMAVFISKQLLQNKINSKTNGILQQAKGLTEAALQESDVEQTDLTSEDFAKLAGDYNATADQLSKEHNIKIYSGQTGLLSARDIEMDPNLAALYLEGYGYHPVQNPATVRLSKVVFAVDELKVSELGRFDVAKPRMHENIGPLKDVGGKIIALVRVIETQEAFEPEKVDYSFNINTLKVDTTDQSSADRIYSVREKVVEDLRKIAAMDTAKAKAEELKRLVARRGYDDAIEEFNKLYGQQNASSEDDPNTFKLQTFNNLQGVSNMSLQVLAVQSSGSPAARFLAEAGRRQRYMVEQLYSLIPADSNSLDTVPLVVEVKPEMSYYLIKRLSVKRIDQDEYEKGKSTHVFKEDFIQSQSAAAVHFNPENIVKRMNYRDAEDNTDTIDANAPVQTQETL